MAAGEMKRFAENEECTPCICVAELRLIKSGVDVSASGVSFTAFTITRPFQRGISIADIPGLISVT
jgi:hypothetical protein